MDGANGLPLMPSAESSQESQQPSETPSSPDQQQQSSPQSPPPDESQQQQQQPDARLLGQFNSLIVFAYYLCRWFNSRLVLSRQLRSIFEWSAATKSRDRLQQFILSTVWWQQQQLPGIVQSSARKPVRGITTILRCCWWLRIATLSLHSAELRIATCLSARRLHSTFGIGLQQQSDDDGFVILQRQQQRLRRSIALQSLSDIHQLPAAQRRIRQLFSLPALHRTLHVRPNDLLLNLLPIDFALII